MTTTGLLGLDFHGMPPFVDEVGRADETERVLDVFVVVKVPSQIGPCESPPSPSAASLLCSSSWKAPRSTPLWSIAATASAGRLCSVLRWPCVGLAVGGATIDQMSDTHWLVPSVRSDGDAGQVRCSPGSVGFRERVWRTGPVLRDLPSHLLPKEPVFQVVFIHRG